MKKQIILFVILLHGLCYAQKTEFALKAGLNISNTRFSVMVNEGSSTRDYDSGNLIMLAVVWSFY